MVSKILEVSEGKVIPGVECYTIPELKALLDLYQDPVPALCYLWALYDPQSPYQELPEEEKENVIAMDYTGEFDPMMDLEFMAAREKLAMLYETPISRFYKSNKVLLDKMSDVAMEAVISTGKDGNITQLQQQILRADKMIEGFKAAENAMKEELKVRGQMKTGYDEI